MQALSTAQSVGAELCGRLYLVVETDVVLPQSFHVVNVHAHHVAQSVRQEHGMCAGANSLLGVAFHQSYLLQAVGHHAANLPMNVIPQHSRFGNVKNVVVTCLHYAIYFELSLREFPVNGESAGVVRAVVLSVLGTSIAQRQSSAFKHIIRWSAVHYLAVLCEDSGETHLLAQ